MTFGNLIGLANAADRILTSLRRDNPEKLLARLADIADDEKALNRLHQDLEQLTRKLAFFRQTPAFIGDTHEPVGSQGSEELREVRDAETGVRSTRRSVR